MFVDRWEDQVTLPEALSSKGIWSPVGEPCDAWWNHSWHFENKERAQESRWGVATEGLCLVQSWRFFSPVRPSSCTSDLFWLMIHACFTQSCWKLTTVKGRLKSRATWTHTHCLKYSMLPDAAFPKHNTRRCLRLPSWSAAITSDEYFTVTECGSQRGSEALRGAP